jgi:hypothetical protein
MMRYLRSTTLISSVFVAVLAACAPTGVRAYDGPERPESDTARLEKPNGIGLTIRGPDKVVTAPVEGEAVFILAPGKHSLEWDPQPNQAMRPEASGLHVCTFAAAAGHRYVFKIGLLSISSLTTDSEGNATSAIGTDEFFVAKAGADTRACTFEPATKQDNPPSGSSATLHEP